MPVKTPKITRLIKDIKKLKKLKKWIKKNDGKVPGTKKGDVTFKNREGKLAKTDANGKPIEYTEYDVNPTPSGARRDAERLVKTKLSYLSSIIPKKVSSKFRPTPSVVLSPKKTVPRFFVLLFKFFL